MAKGLRLTEAELLQFLGRGRAAQAAVDAVVAKSPPRQSHIELRLAQQIVHAGLDVGMQREYFFMDSREFRFDFAWPKIKVAVEVQGMSHRIKAKFQADIEKRALAMLQGWRVLEVDGASVRDGRALGWLKELLWHAEAVTP